MRHFRLSDRSLFKATSAWLLSLELLRLQFGDKVGDMSTAAEDFETLPVVTTVDVFVSHAWSTSAGLKYLGICHYLNLGAAVKAACTAWMFTGACLVVQAGGVSRVATASGASGLLELVGMLVYWPMLVFFLVYFLGHRWHRERYWFDKLCVHQHDPEMKNRAICSLPLFVMNSRRLLVLWDESYFERLWCARDSERRIAFGFLSPNESYVAWLNGQDTHNLYRITQATRLFSFGAAKQEGELKPFVRFESSHSSSESRSQMATVMSLRFSCNAAHHHKELLCRAAPYCRRT